MQTLAAHGYAADRLDYAALQQRLHEAKWRDVVIALTDLSLPRPAQPPLASPSVKK